MTLLDTNLLSEMMKPVPFQPVVVWLAAQPPEALFTTAVSQAELLYGVQSLPRGRRRTQLEEQVEKMLAIDFEGRILPFDEPAARAFATISSGRKRAGRPMSPFDTLIAAIALSHGADLATRNTKDFEGCGVRLINPWDL